MRQIKEEDSLVREMPDVNNSLMIDNIHPKFANPGCKYKPITKNVLGVVNLDDPLGLFVVALSH